LGGVINAYTEFDTTCYYVMLPAEELHEGLQIMSELAFNAAFDEFDIEMEKDIIIEEIKQYANEPESVFIDWIQGSYFLDNPLKNPVLGTLKSVQSASLTKLQNFYQQQYRPENCFLVASGSFKQDTLIKYVEKYFSDWKQNNIVKQKKVKTSPPEQNGFRYLNKSFKSNGDFLAFVLPELAENDTLSTAQLIISKAFASGKQSKLHKRLVEKAKTALSIQLHSISGIYNGITIIQVLPRKAEFIPDIIYAFYDEWLKVRQDFFTSAEIELVKNELNYAWLYDFEYIESVAGSLASEELLGSYKELYNFPDKVTKVTANDFIQCLNKYWQMNYLAVCHQGKNLLPIKLQNNIRKLFMQDLGNLSLPAISTKITSDVSDQINSVVESKKQMQSANDFAEVTLDNGMHLLMRKVCNKPTIGLALTSALSQLCENENQTGFNYLTSNLMLFGTQTRNFDEIQKECLVHGFNIKISHSLETTTIKGKCFPFSFEKMLALTAEIIQFPLFPSDYFNIIRNAIIDINRREKQSPFSFAYNGWVNLFIGKNTNLNKPFGNIAAISQIRLSYLQEWFDNYYSLSNFNICVTGDIDFHKTADICNKYLTSKLKHKPVPEHMPRVNHSPAHIKVRKTYSDQSNLIWGGLGCPSTDFESNTAFHVLSQILGGELASRFFYILREKYGYAYQSGFDFTSVRDLGFWTAFAICDKADYKAVRKLILEIFSDLRTNGVNQEELYSAKNYLKGMQRFDLESLSWQASAISILYALGYDYNYFLNRENRLNAVNRDILKHLAESYMQPENIYTYLES
ncbi:MAG: pitrilysin family protein, partial [Candidatus Cloacimonadaceae bacterium]